MMWNFLKRVVILLVLLAIGWGIYEAYREKPVPVDLASVVLAPMQVTITEEGQTRVKDVYSVSAPIAGHLSRVTLDEGQFVEAGKTEIASIHPLDPPFLDDRTLRELQSSVKAAQSAVKLAEVEHEQAKTALDLAQSEFARTEKLAKKKIAPISQLEKAYNTLQLQKAQVKSANAAITLREAELASLRARLQQPSDFKATSDPATCCIQITAPVDGIVLKIVARSEQAVLSGALIAEIGDPTNLEIIVDLLSRDAAKIAPGAAVLISDWGGDAELVGTVKRIDPAAFTKVSSLGIEEQRVNVIIDIAETPTGLGHGYRVLTSLVIWKSDEVVQVPIAALFRSGGEWATFVGENGMASLHTIKINHLNDETAEVVQGLNPGDQVILYPNDVLKDGSLIEAR